MREDFNKDVILAYVAHLMSEYKEPVMLDFKPVKSLAAINDLLAGEEAGSKLTKANELGIPVKFIGVGEQIDDMKPFDSEEFAKALFEHN